MAPAHRGEPRAEAAAGGDALVALWVRFAAELRALGVRVPPNASAGVLKALQVLGPAVRADVKAAARACLVTRGEDRARFDAAFERFFAGGRLGALDLGVPAERAVQGPARAAEIRPAGGPAAGAARDDAPPREIAIGGRYSAREDLRRKDFARWTAQERASLARLLRRLRLQLPLRPSRRTRPLRGARRGSRLDVQRALRESLRHGELVRLRWREREQRERRLIVVCDVSGSMAAYARALLLLAHALRARQAGLEAFVFATRLTRITAALQGRDLDRMLARIGELARDFSGGTRIGAALRELNQRWLRRLGGSRAVVLVLSDGLDRGDPAVLEAEIERLARGCHRLLWLSPLLGVPGYRPQTRGVQALLPHVDAFLPAHDLASLERLAALLARLTAALPRARARGRAGAQMHPDSGRGVG